MSAELKSKLFASFPDDLQTGESCNAKELYLTANPQKIIEICTTINKQIGLPLVNLFASDERALCGFFMIYYVFADRDAGELLTLKTQIDPQTPQFASIATNVPAAAFYEREIADLFGLTPVGHPDAKRLVFHGNWPQGQHPLRKQLKLPGDYDGKQRPKWAKEDNVFAKVEGEGIFEIPVGPVHAGIIEPGHFRFSVAGEPIINLEAQLYFVHKGIEKLCEGQSIERCLYVSERISGDETIANSLAYCQAVEAVAGAQVPLRAQYGRVLFAELERLTSHLGDLAGVCLDVAYGFAAFQFRMMRGWCYQIADELCGMRFLRSVLRPGGLRRDFAAGKESSAISQLQKLQKELQDTVDIIVSNSLFIDRIENTGVLSREIASDLNAVGPGGRASGRPGDVRKDFPYAAYGRLAFAVPQHNNGDVNCRVNTKIEECFASISLMMQALEAQPQGEISVQLPDAEPYRFAFGLTEAPRGENIHWIMTGEHNTIYRYKIRTPSFCNWPALCCAVRGNVVPDFPLINKSFNLSYAGNDL